MILAVIYYIFTTIIVLILTLFISMPVGLTYIKFIFEPVKGVCKSNARLDNKLVLVTGGNTGIGLETARDLAARGARVVIACRNREKSASAIADIIETTGNKSIEYRYLDLTSFKCIRKFVEDFKKSYDCLDILINNAGCGSLNHKVTEDGNDIVMQINYLGPFLLTNLLLDLVKSSEAGRIITLSSFSHYFGRICLNKLNGLYTTIQTLKYGDSKLCVLMWTKALAKRLPSNVTVNAVHPGFVRTDIFMRSVYPILLDWWLFLLKVFNFKTPKEGAQTSIYLAVSEEVAGVSGKYFVDCAEATYLRVVDNEKIVEKVWNKSVLLTNQ